MSKRYKKRFETLKTLKASDKTTFKTHLEIELIE